MFLIRLKNFIKYTFNPLLMQRYVKNIKNKSYKVIFSFIYEQMGIALRGHPLCSLSVWFCCFCSLSVSVCLSLILYIKTNHTKRKDEDGVFAPKGKYPLILFLLFIFFNIIRISYYILIIFFM